MTKASVASFINQSVLGRYRILRRLARGGMGAVYLGRTEGAAGFARPVVIKRVLPSLMDDQEVAEMFVREAQILSNLQHPNIVGVLDFGQQDDGAYLMVLEYVHGFQLGQWHDYVKKVRGALPVEFAIYVVTRVLDALHYAHTFKRGDGKLLQIIHRDVTPSNVLLTPHGDVKLLDFGIARVSGDETAFLSERTRVKGKLPYLPLECFKGVEPSVQSDIYSTGVVLYELLTGSNPFLGREAAEIYAKILDVVPKSVHASREDAPEEIDAILAKAMHKDASKRFATAAELAHALRQLRVEPDEAVAARLSAALHSDFEGDMPGVIGLEPLALREQVWRNPERPQADDVSFELDLSQPSSFADPIPTPEQVTVRMSVAPELIAATGSTRGGPARRVLSFPAPDQVITARPDMPAPEGATTPQSGAPAISLRRIALVAALAAVLGAATVVGVWLLLAPSSRPQPEEIVVIRQEHSVPLVQSQRPAQPALVAQQPLTAVATARETVAAEPGPPAVLSAQPVTAEPAAAAPNPKALSRSFGRRQRGVEACFDKHAASAPAHPQLSIHFWVDSSGRVTQAEIDPPALRDTALGRCLQDVASRAAFGRLERPVSFHIPITAQQL